MAYQVTFTLNALYTGTTQADNFTIIGKHSGGNPSDTTIATSVTKAQLTAGVTYQVADTITGGTVNSTGTCTNVVSWVGLNSVPSPTPSPTASEDLFVGDLQVLMCGTSEVYYMSSQEICSNNSTLALSVGGYIVGEFVQFALGTNCPGGATYCGQIQAINQVVTRNAIITFEVVSSCTDEIRCFQ